MKLDTKALRYLTSEDWRVLTAVEQGSRNHEVVPTPLIAQLSHVRSGSGVHKSISALAKATLISRTKNARYDGYRLAYGGLDYLALHAHAKAGAVYSVGNQIGTGKESDVFVCAAAGAGAGGRRAGGAAAAAPSVGDGDGDARGGGQRVIKIHRLGRISFRTVKNNRDYLHKQRSSGSWMYMSRLAALKEYTFMSALHEAGFRVPQPLAQNRHTIVMELIDAFPLRQISEVPDPAALYADLMQMIVDLAKVGLIHGDFNEFNILIREDAVEPADGATVPEDGSGDIRLTPVLIDFPQMVSMSHQNAEMYFTRDVDCIKRFFYRRFGFSSDDPGPLFKDAVRQKRKAGAHQIDVAVEASGFSKKMAKELDQYMEEVGAGRDGKDGSEEDEGEQDDDEEEEEGEEDGENSGDNVGFGDELEADSSPNRGAESADLSKPSGHQARSEPTLTVDVT